LTPQISKVVERVLGHLFLPYLEASGAYGPNQLAYRKQRSFMDGSALNVLFWITGFTSGRRIGLYCSDVSGAFDRVGVSRLMRKLAAKGLHPRLLKLISSWLEERTYVVIVDGSAGSPGPLRNSVFQGTVWGPPLWNCHYEDARLAINLQDFVETIFADDLNCFKAFPATVSDSDIQEGLTVCQQSLHSWGAANQVLFDPGKESFHILHPRNHFGNNFYMLGVTFDPQLIMHTACYEIAAVASVRLTALLRTRRLHSTATLVKQYKSQILSSIDFATPAVYHAPSFFCRWWIRSKSMSSQKFLLLQSPH
jgi:hypothetical protein